MPSFFRTEGPSATLAGLSCESSQGSPTLMHSVNVSCLMPVNHHSFCHPNDIAICETHEIKVRRAVIVDEERSINALLIPYRLASPPDGNGPWGVSAVATQICSSVE